MRFSKPASLPVSLICLALWVGWPASAQAFQKHPKLILTIVIDQFRSDYLSRFEGQFLPAKLKNGDLGGFRYLMSQGAYFPFAKYDLIQDMTGPGHATILTGSLPYQNGVSSNDWYDPAQDAWIYCAADKDQTTVGATPSGNRIGTSPKNLIGSTIGDELKNAGYSSKVISLALKDRAAIFMGGHRADLAFWMDSSFKWVSSSYYLPDKKLPDWMNELNQSLAKRKGEKYIWNPNHRASGLSAPDAMIAPGDKIAQKLGKGFPHTVEIGSREMYDTPLGLEMTTDAAIRAFDHYRLGRGKATDVLAVSYSSHDYVGHAYGPNSLEMEEMTLNDDTQVSRLLNHVKKSLGSLSEVVIVLTGDHGAPPNPDLMAANKLPAGRTDDDAFATEMNKRLNGKFGKPDGDAKWIPLAGELEFYVNHRAVQAKGVKIEDIESEIKAYLEAQPGIAFAITATEVAQRKLPPGLLEKQILATYFPGRSANVIAIPRPFFVTDLKATISHHTGYSYDANVPVILSGYHLKPGLYATQAHVIDIAPTLSFLNGILPPALSEGRVLSEAILAEGILTGGK